MFVPPSGGWLFVHNQIPLWFVQNDLPYFHLPNRRWVFWCVVGVCLALCFSWVTGQAALAQTDATPPAAPASEDAVNAVARQLWCPLCSGVRLDACELRACAQMKDVIAEKLVAGEDVQSIKSYFVQQYGPQVLGEPPLEGFNWLAWILPVAVLVGGGIFLWTFARRIGRRRPAASSADTQSSAAEADPYATKLEEELKQYD